MTCSRTVSECKDALNSLDNVIMLVWAPGNSGIEENEAADGLAKKGSTEDPIGPQPILPIPRSVVTNELKITLKRDFEQNWRNAPRMRQAKEFVTGPNSRHTKELLRFSRKDLRIIVGLLTGHYHVKKHLHRMGIEEDAECRWCLEEEETVFHIIGECPAVTRIRYQHMGKPVMTTDDIRKTHRSRLLAFAKAIGLE